MTASAPDLLEGAQNTMAFVLDMRARGVSDLRVLRALETVPRARFVPNRYADLAWRNIALPIGCGQTTPEPLLVARMMEALEPKPGHRVLEIGTGSGYATAVVSQLAGEIVSIERFASLTIEARTRLRDLGFVDITVEQGDGLDLPDRLGLFDRILVHGSIVDLPPQLVAAMASGGIAVFAKKIEGSKKSGRLVRHIHRDGRGFAEESLAPCRLPALIPGIAQTL